MPTRAFGGDDKGGKKDDVLRAGHMDVTVPKTREEFIAKVNQGIARAFEMATSAKELKDVIDSATKWFEVQFAKDQSGPTWGSGLPGQQNGKVGANV